MNALEFFADKTKNWIGKVDILKVGSCIELMEQYKDYMVAKLQPWKDSQAEWMERAKKSEKEAEYNLNLSSLLKREVQYLDRENQEYLTKIEDLETNCEEFLKKIESLEDSLKRISEEYRNLNSLYQEWIPLSDLQEEKKVSSGWKNIAEIRQKEIDKLRCELGNVRHEYELQSKDNATCKHNYIDLRKKFEDIRGIVA